MAEPIDAQVQELGDFLQRYHTRRVHPVLWVGAGAGAAAGYPTLGQLEQLLRAQLPGVDQTGFALIDAFLAQYSEADRSLELQQHIAQPRPFVPLHEAALATVYALLARHSRDIRSAQRRSRGLCTPRPPRCNTWV